MQPFDCEIKSRIFERIRAVPGEGLSNIVCIWLALYSKLDQMAVYAVVLAASILIVFIGIGTLRARSRRWQSRELQTQEFRERHSRGAARLRSFAPLGYMMPDGLYGCKLRPGKHGRKLWINPQGFPQREPVARKCRSTFRVLCLGESPAFGRDTEHNFPAYLGNLLEKNASRAQAFEVINCGVPGWLSDQTAMRAHYELARLGPDAVVLYMGFNDFQAYDPLGLPPQVSAFDQTYGPHEWTRPSANIATSSAPRDQTFRFLIANLDHIVAEFRKANRGVKLVVCTLAVRWPRGIWGEQFACAPEPWWAKHHGLHAADVATHVDEFNQVLRDFASTRHLPVADAAAVFRTLDCRRLFWDWGHMTSLGLQILAGVIHEAIREHGIVAGREDSSLQRMIAKYRAETKTRFASTG
jgi:lysophospholipase L1-like esterase